ncbi:hypothetical protein HKX48_009497 [Thoreauomyces humboldtii]|nr:hypothetical protein HKX48_009497 [Thoreauomyces humboldtii]
MSILETTIRRRSSTALGSAGTLSETPTSTSEPPDTRERRNSDSIAPDYSSGESLIKAAADEIAAAADVIKPVRAAALEATSPPRVKWEDQQDAGVSVTVSHPPEMTSIPARPRPDEDRPGLMISRPLHQHLSTMELPHRVSSIMPRRVADLQADAEPDMGRRGSMHSRQESFRVEPPSPQVECTNPSHCSGCSGLHHIHGSIPEDPKDTIPEPMHRQYSINGSLFGFRPAPRRQASALTTASAFTSAVNPGRSTYATPHDLERNSDNVRSMSEAEILDLHDQIYTADPDATVSDLIGGFETPVKRRWKSTATMFTGLSKVQRVRIRDFLMGLARAFSKYGAPSHRIEYMMELVALALEQPASFVVIPGVIWVSFGDEDHASSTHLIKVAQGWHMYKLSCVNQLCKSVISGELDMHDAIPQLAEIAATPSYPAWLEWLAYPAISFILCVISFGGGWVDSVIACSLGAVVGIVCVFSSRIREFTHLIPFLMALFCSFITRVLFVTIRQYNPTFCYNETSIVLSSIVQMFPGLSITISLIEIATKNMVSGTVRIFFALFHAMMLGIGISAGRALVTWGPSDLDAVIPGCTVVLSKYWNFLFFPPLCAFYLCSFQARRPQFLHISIVSTIGWTTYLFLSMMSLFQTSAGQIVPSALAAFSIGVAANIYARITKDVAVPAIIVGIVQLVPGSMGVRATLGFFGQNSTDSMQVVFEMLMVGMSIGIGLFMASLAVFPVKGPRYKYMTV